MNGYLLGVTTAGEQRANAVADSKIAYGGADFGNYSGHFESHIRRGSRRRWVIAATLEKVCPVYAGGMDIDKDLIGSRLRVSHLLPQQSSLGSVVSYNYGIQEIATPPKVKCAAGETM